MWCEARTWIELGPLCNEIVVEGEELRLREHGGDCEVTTEGGLGRVMDGVLRMWVCSIDVGIPVGAGTDSLLTYWH